MRRIATTIALILFAAIAATGQELVFFDGQIRVFEDVDGDLFELQDSRDGMIDFGYRLSVRYVVRTYDGFAEILLPNGHIVKLGADTEIRLDSVVAAGSTGTDSVSVSGGRVRSVVAGLTGTGRGFQVRTPTAVGGVRGTDFVTQVTDGAEIVAVLQGNVDFTNRDGTTIRLAANEFANAVAAQFIPTQANVAQQFYGPLEDLSDRIQEAKRQALSPADPDPADADTDQPEQPAPDPAETVVATPQPVAPTPAPEPPSGDGVVDELMAGLMRMLALEIGTISIEGQTFSKLVVQPTFRIGRLRAGLYLPLIYSGNLFDPDDRYKPRGNNEWSFGTDQDWVNEPFVAIADLMGDIALKIKFIEWGSMRDPFFLKVGNLNSLQLGHGLLMRNYANDTDFPAVRRIGFNTGINRNGYGFEVLVNDLARPEIFGARVFARPIPQLPVSIGLGGVTDIAPARELPSTDTADNPIFGTERTADPIFVNLAVDVELPIIERNALSLVLFADVGGLLPYLRAPAGGLDDGFQTQALTYEAADGREFRNYGIATGLFGHISVLDYRLEFQNYHGVFEPAFYGPDYDRIRGERVRQTIAYLQDPGATAYENETLGIYGEAGFNLAGVLRFEAGYLWPWSRDPQTNEVTTGSDDYLKAGLGLTPGLLPLGISGGFSYERRSFMPTLLDKPGFQEAKLIDENTVLRGEIAYPIAPIMDIVASVSWAPVRDSAGLLVYEERGSRLRPKYGTVINIETRLGGSGF